MNKFSLKTLTRRADFAPVTSADPEGEAETAPTREFDVVFSTETPVHRHFGLETLDHSTRANIRLDYLNNTRVALWNHNPDDMIGNVSGVVIDQDKRQGRARVKLGTHGRAAEILGNIEAGTQYNVSFAYWVHDAEVEKGDRGQPETVRITDWEPLEISFVSLPADPNTGMGDRFIDDLDKRFLRSRSIYTLEDKIMTDAVDKAETKAADTPEIRSIDPKREQELKKDAATQRSNESAEIIEIGMRWDMMDVAQQFIREGKSLSDFQTEVLKRADTSHSPKTVKQENPADLGMEEKEIRNYSLMAAANAVLEKDWRNAGLEREVNDEICKRMGKTPRRGDFYLPIDVLRRSVYGSKPSEVARLRSLGLSGTQFRAPPTATTKATEGAELVGTMHDAGSFIEFLYANSVLLRRGAIVIGDLVQNLSIPRQDGSQAATYVTEEAGATVGSFTSGALTLSPHILNAPVSATRLMLKTGLPDVEQLIRNDLAMSLALGLDLAGFEGSGAGANPEGIFNATGVNTQTIAVAGQPTWSELVGFETAVLTDNALVGPAIWVTTAAVNGHTKTTLKSTGVAGYLQEMGMINGYGVEVSTQLTANRIYFGLPSQVILAFWGAIEIQVDTATLAAAGGVVLRGWSDNDIGVRQPGAWCVNA